MKDYITQPVPLSPLPPHKALCIRSSTFGNKVCDCSVLNCQTDIFIFIHKIEGGNSGGIHSEHPQFQRDLAVINPPNQMQHSDSDCGAGTVETNLTRAETGWNEGFLDFSGYSWSVSSLNGSLTLLYLPTKNNHVHFSLLKPKSMQSFYHMEALNIFPVRASPERFCDSCSTAE